MQGRLGKKPPARGKVGEIMCSREGGGMKMEGS
jgi:hypothetical protein